MNSAFAADGPWFGPGSGPGSTARSRGDRRRDHHDHHNDRRHGRRDDRQDRHHGDRHGDRHGGPWQLSQDRRGADFGFRDFPFRGFPGFPGFPGGGPHGRRGRRGPRAARGDVRAGILALLAEEPRNGYQIIQELESRSNGVWRPSPGSVYPALSQLEDEGLVVVEQTDSKRTFRLTDEGRAYVEAHPDEVRAPWEAMADSVGSGMHELHDLLGQTAFAAVQVARAGTEAQVAQARALLDETRKGLYRLLAEDDTDAGTDATPES